MLGQFSRSAIMILENLEDVSNICLTVNAVEISCKNIIIDVLTHNLVKLDSKTNNLTGQQE